MKRLSLIFAVIVFACPCFSADKPKDSSSMTSVFPALFQSSEMETRITAIVLAAEFKESEITRALVKMLPETKGIDKVAVLYSLSRAVNDDYMKAFIESIPGDEAGIKELLDIESPRKSYFASPHLRILSYLGDLALDNDLAFSKLQQILKYADGWQGDSIMEMVEDAKQTRSESKTEVKE